VQIHYSIDNFKGKNIVLAIGSFDGVHQGHLMVLKKLIKKSIETQTESALMIFWPHPRTVLSPHGKDFKLINTIDERIKLLSKTGIDHLIIYPFNYEFSRQTACLFIEKILRKKLGVSYFFIGFNQRFGSDRVSNINEIKNCCQTWGIEAEQLTVCTKKENLSSTSIRDALFRGEIQTANNLLNYKFSLEGVVVGGNKIGRSINYPTANIQVNETYKLIPPDGVYAVQVLIKERLYNGMLNIGMRPTVNGKIKTIEAHIFDFNTDIYTETIKLFFIKRLRKEMRFGNITLLKEQLKKDEIESRKILNSKIKISIAPDSFKGSLSSIEVCNTIEKAFSMTNHHIEPQLIPLADGGEGSIDVLKFHLPELEKIKTKSKNPLLKEIDSYYYIDINQNIAFIELAKSSGLNTIEIKDQNPLLTSTYGTGLQIKDAIEKQFHTIILFVGGSATNDAGLGILYALGYRFSGIENRVPAGMDLQKITGIYPSEKKLPKIIIASDVTNPFTGENGAVYTYAQQKGASTQDLNILEKGMKNIQKIIEQKTEIKLNDYAGTGSAGGVSGSLFALLKAQIVSGADLIFELINFKEKIKNSDLLITGEGQMDEQSLQGKLINRIQNLNHNSIPIWAIAGYSENKNRIKALLDIWHISSISKNDLEKEQSLLNPKNELEKQVTTEIEKVIQKLVVK